MKTFSAIFFAIAMSCLAAAAQSVPKLAVAGVSVSPTLAQQFNMPVAVDTNTPVQSGDLEGVWDGTTKSDGAGKPFILTVTKSANGSEYAEFKNVIQGNLYHSTSVSSDGSHVTIAFNEDGESQSLDGNLDASRSTMNLKWRTSKGLARFTLKRSQVLSNSKSSAGTGATPLDLDSISRALNIELANSFEADHAFSVLESDDLKSAIPSKENEPYNLKDSGTAKQFKQAGINYLLVTSLEELKNDTVDKAQGTVAYQTANAKLQASGKSLKNDAAVASSASALKTQGKFDAHRVIEQDVYLMVRCRLFDVASGELLDSGNYSYSTNRTSVVLAEGNKEISDVDLFDVAAKNISAQAVARSRKAILKRASAN